MGVYVHGLTCLWYLFPVIHIEGTGVRDGFILVQMQKKPI